MLNARIDEERRGGPLTADRASVVWTYLRALAVLDPDRAAPILRALFREGGVASDAAALSIRWSQPRRLQGRAWEWEQDPELVRGVITAAKSTNPLARRHAGGLLRSINPDGDSLPAIWDVVLEDPSTDWYERLPWSPVMNLDMWRQPLPMRCAEPPRGMPVTCPSLIAALDEGGAKRQRALAIIVRSGFPVAGAVSALEQLVREEPADVLAWMALEVVDPRPPTIRGDLERPEGYSRLPAWERGSARDPE